MTINPEMYQYMSPLLCHAVLLDDDSFFTVSQWGHFCLPNSHHVYYHVDPCSMALEL